MPRNLILCGTGWYLLATATMAVKNIDSVLTGYGMTRWNPSTLVRFPVLLLSGRDAAVCSTCEGGSCQSPIFWKSPKDMSLMLNRGALFMS